MASRKSKKAFWIILLLLFLVAAIIAAGIFFRVDIKRLFGADMPDKEAGAKYVIPISTGSTVVTENEFIYICEGNSISVYSSSGEFVRSFILPYSNMQLSYSDSYVAAYDMNTSSYTVFSKGAKLNEYEAENPINYIFMQDEFLFLFCQGGKGYAATVYCVDLSEDLLYMDIHKNSIYYSLKHPIYVDMSADKNHFVIVSIIPDALDKTYAELYELSKSTPIASVSMDGFYPKTALLADKNFLLLAEESIFSFDHIMQSNKLTGLGPLVYTQSISDGVLLLTKEEDAYALHKYDNEANAAWSKKIHYEAEGIAMTEDKILLWSGRNVEIYNAKGNMFHEIENDASVLKVLPAGARNIAIVMADKVIVYRY